MRLGQVGEVRVPVQVVLGGTEVTVEELAAMTEGTVIRLESLAGEPVDLVAAGETIARGEVVVIDENFGLRVTRITGAEEV